MATSQDHAPPQMIHYAPGDRPLCGESSWATVYSDDPGQVAGCVDCLHCRQEISAQRDVEWRRVVRRPCPHCGRPGW